MISGVGSGSARNGDPWGFLIESSARRPDTIDSGIRPGDIDDRNGYLMLEDGLQVLYHCRRRHDGHQFFHRDAGRPAADRVEEDTRCWFIFTGRPSI
jgi:hypothetical protein